VEINGDYKLKASPELVWSKIMGRYLPACEKLLYFPPEEYQATLKNGVASMIMEPATEYFALQIHFINRRWRLA